MVFELLSKSYKFEQVRKRPKAETVCVTWYWRELRLWKNRKINKLFPLFSQNLNIQSPIGLIWDENDYSCTYNSLFTVLYHIWNEGQLSHRSYFENGTQLAQILHSHFVSLLNKTSSFESVRNQLRAILNHNNPLRYPYRKVYTDIDQLVEILSPPNHMEYHI